MGTATSRWCALALVALMLAACQKFEGPNPGKAAAPTPATPKVEKKESAKEPPKEEKSPEQPPTFAQRAKKALADVQNQMAPCLEKFVDEMQMEKIDQGFLPVDLNRMDEACREPIGTYKKASAPMDDRERELIARRAELDEAFEHAARFSDAYLRMSQRLRQLGARERWKVVRDIRELREEVQAEYEKFVIAAKSVLDWPDDLEDECDVEQRTLDDRAYRDRLGELVAWLDRKVPSYVEDYDRYAYHPADIYQGVHVFKFRHSYFPARRWLDLQRARFEALECEGKRCAAAQKAAKEAFEAADAVLATIAKGRAFYRKSDYDRHLDKADTLFAELKDRRKAFEKASKKARRAVR